MRLFASATLASKISGSMRKLAYVAKVDNLLPIRGKDRIVLAEIKGWKCIVKKDEFKVGDFCVYIGIDSVPDFDDPNFSFLREKRSTTERIKTMKMGGVVFSVQCHG